MEVYFKNKTIFLQTSKLHKPHLHIQICFVIRKAYNHVARIKYASTEKKTTHNIAYNRRAKKNVLSFFSIRKICNDE